MEMSDGVANHVGHVDGLKLALGLCLCYILCFGCLRIWLRWRAYGIDDLVVLISTSLALGFFGCGYVSAGYGLGHPIDDIRSSPQSTIDKLNASITSGQIIWILSLCLSKIAVIAVLMRTTVTPSHKRIQYAALVAVAVQGIASIALATAACKFDDQLSWNFQANTTSCPNQEKRWQAITGFDIATEGIILFLPVHLVWGLQMSPKAKAIVTIAFWLRFPTMIFSLLRNNETRRLARDAEPSLTGALVVVWQSIELAYSLAAVTIAALKNFTENLNTGFGNGEIVRLHGISSQAHKMSQSSSNKGKSSNSSGTRLGTKSSRNTLHSTELSEYPKETTEHFDCGGLKLRPDACENSAEVFSPGHSLPRSGRPSVAREREKELGTETRDDDAYGIRHEVQYSVHYDEAPLVERNI